MSWLKFATDPRLGGLSIGGETFLPARMIGAALFGEKMDDAMLATFRDLSGGLEVPNPDGYREAWLIAGRRSSKSLTIASAASYAATVGAASFELDKSLAPGERAVVACFAVDRAQAGVIFNYLKGIFQQPALASMVVRETLDTLVLNNRIEIVVMTSESRRARGRSIVFAAVDEAAFILDDADRPRASELIDEAIRPAQLTLPLAKLAVASSPYRKAGIVFETHRDHFGKPDPELIVFGGPTWKWNLAVREESLAIRRAYERDPAVAASEYGGAFRESSEQLFKRDVLEEAVERGVRSRPPQRGIKYFAAVDPSSGSQDGMAITVSHMHDDRVVFDLCIEAEAPFRPADTFDGMIDLLIPYGITRVYGDRGGGQFPREYFRKRGIEYIVNKPSTSDCYLHAVAQFNSRRVVLLDDDKTVGQFNGLERTLTGTGERIDHRRFGHDDRSASHAFAIYHHTKERTFHKRRRVALPITFDARGEFNSKDAAWDRPEVEPQPISQDSIDLVMAELERDHREGKI